jgi:hypothetical protein
MLRHMQQRNRLRQTNLGEAQMSLEQEVAEMMEQGGRLDANASPASEGGEPGPREPGPNETPDVQIQTILFTLSGMKEAIQKIAREIDESKGA